MRADAYHRWQRQVKLATTYTRNAGDLMHAFDPERDLPEFRAAMAWDYLRLLNELLEVADEILNWLPDEMFQDETVGDLFGLGVGPMHVNQSDTVAEKADKVVAALELRQRRAAALRRIEALENVVGRSPQEAAAYQAKAQELRGRR